MLADILLAYKDGVAGSQATISLAAGWYAPANGVGSALMTVGLMDVTDDWCACRGKTKGQSEGQLGAATARRAATRPRVLHSRASTRPDAHLSRCTATAGATLPR